MDLGKEFSVYESVDDNEEIGYDFVSDKLGSFGESNVQNNGSSVVENNGLSPEVKQKGGEASARVNTPHVDLKPQASPSPKTTRKGFGLKKWKRIRRDAIKGGDSSIDTGKMVKHELSNSGVNPSKRIQYAERKQKSEGSVSSTDAVLRSLDDFALLDDSSLGLGPPFAAETDSENSEDRSSKSSTAASAPKMKFEIPTLVGFPRDRSKMRSLSGKNLTGQKARGERVKIEKENSHSSLESDSRSSNFVFMQGTYSSNNGIRNERSKDYDEEDGDEAQGSGTKVAHGHRGGYSREGAHEDLSPEDVVADSSSEVKEERSENHGSSGEQDPLGELMSPLQCLKEALEQVVLKFKELGKDVSIDDSVSDLCTEDIDIKQEIHETISGQLSSGEGKQSISQDMQSEVVETENRDVETELEDLFKQKIVTEVEYIAMSRINQKLRVAAADQITVLKEQKALASEQTQILDKLGQAENKAVMIKREAEKLEHICEDMARADETMKLQRRVCKYSSCFFVQLVMLAVTLGVYILQLSPNYVEVVPT